MPAVAANAAFWIELHRYLQKLLVSVYFYLLNPCAVAWLQLAEQCGKSWLLKVFVSFLIVSEHSFICLSGKVLWKVLFSDEAIVFFCMSKLWISDI